MASTYNSNSIGLYLKDIRAIKRNSLTDKFSNDPKYKSLLEAWQSSENEMIANPADQNKLIVESKRRAAVEEYINSNYTQDEISALPLTTNKGNRDKEIENCLPLVYSMAMYYAKQSNIRTSFEDLVAYGNLGLVIAAEKYFTTEVPSESIARLRTKGFAKFSTFAWAWIKKTITEGSNEMGSLGFGGNSKTKAEANKEIKVIGDDISGFAESSSASSGQSNGMSLEINQSMGSFEDAEIRAVYNDIQELEKYVKTVFRPLSKYEKRILFMALGIDTPNGIIYKCIEIAEIMDVSKATISRDLSKAYNKLRRTAKQKLHGEDAVTLAALLIGNPLTDINLPELRMDSTSGYASEDATVTASNIKKYRTEF